ncbi:ribosome silencing factor [Rubritepida flocculans]|uniref:ribosome silencing factor n=1 Tax=Rubritepida flocculans TaxID=182403 RepID=UPI0004009CE4|nr:ribosome silencing factor [Rubritepida flocculans]
MARTTDKTRTATRKPAATTRARTAKASAAKAPAATAKPARTAAAKAGATPPTAKATKAAKAPAPKTARTSAARAPATQAGASRKAAATPAAKRPAASTATLRAAPRRAAKPSPAKAVAAKPAAAGAPRRPRARRAPADPGRLERLVAAAVKSLEDDKAEDVLVLDIASRASYADRLVIATGLADRQIQAMAAHLDEALGKEGLRLRRDAIQGSDDWVLIDAGDLVIHLFKPDKRAEIALEKMWGPDSPPPEPSGGSPI